MAIEQIVNRVIDQTNDQTGQTGVFNDPRFDQKS